MSNFDDEMMEYLWKCNFGWVELWVNCDHIDKLQSSYENWDDFGK